MRPSIAHVSEQLDQRLAASRHTTAPISHTRSSPPPRSLLTRFPSNWEQETKLAWARSPVWSHYGRWRSVALRWVFYEELYHNHSLPGGVACRCWRHWHDNRRPAAAVPRELSRPQTGPLHHPGQSDSTESSPCIHCRSPPQPCRR